MATDWSAKSETETEWGHIICRWLLGEQPSHYPEHAGERLLFSDHDKLGGWCEDPIHTDFSAVSGVTTPWT